jgi:dehydrogenase/reductase SDR family member 7B
VQRILSINQTQYFMKGKRIWITGASSGIGEALAKAFALQGANLILSARNESELYRVKAACSQNAKEIMVVPMDVSQHEEVFKTAEKILNQVGKIDILINNAGISQRSLVKNTDFSVDKRILDVDYFGTVALTKAVLPSMLLHKLGHIVVITSVLGYIGTPVRSAYSAAKHALHGYFDSLRAEVWQDNIQVLLVVPGFIKTNISINALTSDGKAQGKMDEDQTAGIEPDYLARKVLAAIEDGKEEIYVGGTKEIAAIYVKRFFPKWFSKIVRKMKTT